MLDALTLVVYISKLEMQFSRLSYEAVLASHGLDLAVPYLRIDRPELGLWQFLQPPPQEPDADA